MDDLSVISTVIYVILAILTLIGLLAGRKRGIGRQSVRFFTVALSVLIAFLLARGTFGMLAKRITDETIAEILTATGTNDSVGDIAKFIDAELVHYLLALPTGLIIAPMLFVIYFIITSALMLIIHKIISRALGFKKNRNSGKTRLLGMALGAVQGVLVTAIILCPIMGIFKTANDTVTALEDSGEVDKASLAEYHKISDVVEGNVFYKVFSTPSKNTYDALTVLKLDGQKMRMSELFDTALVLVTNAGDLGEIDFTDITEDDKETISTLIDAISDNDYLLTVSAGIARAFGEAKLAEEGEPLPDGEEPTPTDKAMESIYDALYDTLTTMNSVNLKGDIVTIKEVFFLVVDSGLIAKMDAGDDMIAILIEPDAETGDNLIAAVIRKIENNSHLAPLVPVLNDAAITLAFESAEIEGLDSESAKAMVSDLKTGLNDMLSINKDNYTPEEYHEQISNEVENVVESALLNTEFELSDDEKAAISDEIANYIIENDMLEQIKAENKEELTDADVINIISQYYSVLVPDGEGDGGEPDGE